MTPLSCNRTELVRFAHFVAELYINCHKAYRATRPATPWTSTVARLDQMVADLLSEMVMRGDLFGAAESLVDPEGRCCCGMRFVAQVEEYLEPAELRRLHELWEQPEIDIGAELMALANDLDD